MHFQKPICACVMGVGFCSSLSPTVGRAAVVTVTGVYTGSTNTSGQPGGAGYTAATPGTSYLFNATVTGGTGGMAPSSTSGGGVGGDAVDVAGTTAVFTAGTYTGGNGPPLVGPLGGSPSTGNSGGQGVDVSAGGSAVVDGGSFVGGTGTLFGGPNGVGSGAFLAGGSLTIDGGTFASGSRGQGTDANGAGVTADGGVLSINGGTIFSDPANSILPNASVVDSGAEVDVHGGTFTDTDNFFLPPTIYDLNGGIVNIYGQNFTVNGVPAGSGQVAGGLITGTLQDNPASAVTTLNVEGLFGTGAAVTVNLIVVPEPATSGTLLAAGVGLLATRGRRRV